LAVIFFFFFKKVTLVGNWANKTTQSIDIIQNLQGSITGPIT